ncbi:MAG: type II pantothenate kinase [Clostridia bacterium]
MKNIIGIDIGGSTTKIIGYRDGATFSPLIVKADDPKASLFGAFGKFVSENNLELTDIDKVMLTGVGAIEIAGDLFGVPTTRIAEFNAIGAGGLFLSGLDKAIIVSMGTGTAFVVAEHGSVRHIGGTGVGGGTLLGLSGRILNVRSFDDLVETAKSGNLDNVDLTIKDISNEHLDSLPPHMTASNFGKISDLATSGDLALGIINLVFQTIGVISVFASSMEGTKNIVLTGNLTHVPQIHEIFDLMETLYDVKFIIPQLSEYATATGAALMSGMGGKE